MFLLFVLFFSKIKVDSNRIGIIVLNRILGRASINEDIFAKKCILTQNFYFIPIKIYLSDSFYSSEENLHILFIL